MKNSVKKICLAAAAAVCITGLTPVVYEASASDLVKTARETMQETASAVTEAIKEAGAVIREASGETAGLTGETESQAASGETKSMYTTWNLAFRAKASKESEKLGSVPINTEVTLLDASADYYEIEYNGTRGYVLGEYLTEDKAAAQAAEDESKAAAAAEKKSSSSTKKSSSKSSSKKSSSSSKKKSSSKKSSSSDSKKKNDQECLTGGLLN